MNALKSKLAARTDLADLAGIATLIGLTALFVFGVVMPLAMRSHRAQADAEEAARRRQQANAVASNVRDARAEFDRVRAQLAASSLQIDPPSALNGRLSRLITLGSEHNLSLNEIKPGEATSTKRYTITPVRLVGTGTYPDVARFLHLLHERMSDLVVVGFKMERGADIGVGRCELEFRWIARPGVEVAPPAVATVQ